MQVDAKYYRMTRDGDKVILQEIMQEFKAKIDQNTIQSPLLFVYKYILPNFRTNVKDYLHPKEIYF
jgi:hypothetical protein